MEEKNHLSNELERTKKKLEESTESKARTDAQLERLKNELNFKTVMVQKDAHEAELRRYLFLTFSHFFFIFTLQADMQKQVQKTQLEIENIRRQMLQQEIHFNIQQTEALTR